MAVFQRYAEYYDLLYRDKNYSKEVDYIDQLIKKYYPGSKTILDLGCGTGRHALYLAKKGYEVTGIDGAKGMIDVAKQQSLQSGLSNVSFIVLDSESFSLKPESYDAVVCSSVLEYVQNDKMLLCNLVKVLRPGGVLLISVPHMASFFGRIEDIMIHIPGFKRARPIGPALAGWGRKAPEQLVFGGVAEYLRKRESGQKDKKVRRPIDDCIEIILEPRRLWPEHRFLINAEGNRGHRIPAGKEN